MGYEHLQPYNCNFQSCTISSVVKRLVYLDRLRFVNPGLDAVKLDGKSSNLGPFLFAFLIPILGRPSQLVKMNRH